MFRGFLTAVAFLLATAFLAQAATIPSPKGNVSDYANKLSQTEISNLTRQTVIIKDRVKVAIAIVPDMGGETIEHYAQEMFHQWGVGDKKTDKGVLILIAMKERKIRIQTGYGVEADIPDHVAKDIINKMTPYLSKGKFYNGLDVGITEINKRIK